MHARDRASLVWVRKTTGWRPCNDGLASWPMKAPLRSLWPYVPTETISAARTAPLVLAFSEYVATITPVEGRSMQPTLNPGISPGRDAVLIDRMFASWYKRGDVLVLSSPIEPSEMVIKRVVALGGDWVRRRDPSADFRAGDFVRVPAGHLWVEGDNERFSNDSNTYGAVPAGLVRAACWGVAAARGAGRQEAPSHRIMAPGGIVQGAWQHRVPAGGSSGDRGLPRGNRGGGSLCVDLGVYRIFLPLPRYPSSLNNYGAHDTRSKRTTSLLRATSRVLIDTSSLTLSRALEERLRWR